MQLNRKAFYHFLRKAAEKKRKQEEEKAEEKNGKFKADPKPSAAELRKSQNSQ